MQSLQESQEGGFSATTHNHHHLSPPPPTTTTKRPLSPSSTSPSPNKSHKKTPNSQPFSKITLPITFPSPSPPSPSPSGNLFRTLSEPISSSSSLNKKNAPFSPFSASSSANFLNFKNQENGEKSFMGKALSPSPPASSKNSLHRLLRSVSDPTTLSFGTQNGETTPSSKRLEKMKGIVKGISQLCDEVIYEDEDEELQNEDPNKDGSDSDTHDHSGEDQEAVSVEKKGDCLVLHFNCPCGLGYEILLSGKDCYYRLT